MADRKGGKVVGDAGTKQDKPSEQEGKGTPAKEELQTKEAAQATGQEKTAEKAKPKPRKPTPRKPRTAKAEATAAEETGVGKEAAEAAEKAPSGQRKTPAARTRARDRAEARTEKAEPAAPVQRVVVRANAKYVRTSARKARLVCDHIRGKSVEEAFAILAHTPRHVAEDWRKLLQSAVANAEHNHELLGDDLRIASVKADEGPTLKRFRPRAMGRATKIRKRTSHLTITLTPKD
jgi:ribosomal protein L22